MTRAIGKTGLAKLAATVVACIPDAFRLDEDPMPMKVGARISTDLARAGFHMIRMAGQSGSNPLGSNVWHQNRFVPLLHGGQS